MATYSYPEARELREIGPNLMAQETLNDPLLGRVFPIVNTNSPMLMWSIDEDDYGLQQLRGLDGSPLSVNRLGKTNYSVEPGYFGEFETVGERELTLAAGNLLGEGTVDVGGLVAKAYAHLRKREVTRIRKICWDLLTTGTFTVLGKESTLSFTDTFALATYSASDWSTAASSTPLADFRAVQLTGSEYGVNFGSSAIAVMNRVTANRLFANSNAADLGGRKTAGGGTITSQGATNTVMMGEDLPEIVVYDSGYKNDSGTFTKFVADDKVVVIGTRDAGDRIGEYRMTRNASNPNFAPGHYEFIQDYANGINAPKTVPPRIVINGGHNGGPVIFRPKAITIMSV